MFSTALGRYPVHSKNLHPTVNIISVYVWSGYILWRRRRSIRLPGKKADNDEIMFVRFVLQPQPVNVTWSGTFSPSTFSHQPDFAKLLASQFPHAVNAATPLRRHKYHEDGKTFNHLFSYTIASSDNCSSLHAAGCIVVFSFKFECDGQVAFCFSK